MVAESPHLPNAAPCPNCSDAPAADIVRRENGPFPTFGKRSGCCSRSPHSCRSLQAQKSMLIELTIRGTSLTFGFFLKIGGSSSIRTFTMCSQAVARTVKMVFTMLARSPPEVTGDSTSRKDFCVRAIVTNFVLGFDWLCTQRCQLGAGLRIADEQKCLVVSTDMSASLKLMHLVHFPYANYELGLYFVIT